VGYKNVVVVVSVDGGAVIPLERGWRMDVAVVFVFIVVCVENDTVMFRNRRHGADGTQTHVIGFP
jgi:hypothetical protein